MIIKLSILTTGRDLDGGDIVIIDFVIAGVDDVAATLEQFFHDVKIFLDLVIRNSDVTSADGNIDAVVRIRENSIRYFLAVFFIDFGGSQSVKIGWYFDEEFFIVEVIIFSLNFFAFAIFDGERVAVNGGAITAFSGRYADSDSDEYNDDYSSTNNPSDGLL